MQSKIYSKIYSNISSKIYFSELINPTDIPDCILWLDADDTSSVTLSGNDVSQWNDKSGNNNHATQPGAGKPEYVRNVQNGRNGLDFVQASTEHLILTPMTNPASDYDFFFVVNQDNTNSNAYMFDSSVGRIGIGRDLGTNYVDSYLDIASSWVNSDVKSSGIQLVNWGLSSTTGADYYKNGDLLFSGGAYTQAALGVATTLGARFGGTITFDGIFHEVLVFKRKLSDSERAIITTYLLNKWAVDFKPTYLENCHTWLDANDASTVTLNGSNVSQWDDKSGNNRHAKQPTAAKQPLYTIKGQNNLNTITLDGSDDNFAFDNSFNIQDKTILVVVNVDDAVMDTDDLINKGLFGKTEVANFDYHITLEPRLVTRPNFTIIENDAGGISRYVNGLISNPDMKNPLIFSFIDKYPNGTSSRVRISNIQDGSGRANLGVTTLQYLGAGYGGAPNNKLKGQLMEVIIFDRTATTGEILQLNKYLSGKWGITLLA